MSQNINKATGQPWRILWFGDLVAPSGFGRIGNEVGKRLVRRGYQLQGAAINYTGWPHDLGFHVWPLQPDIWGGLVNVVNQVKPDILIGCQDFPYHHMIWHGCRLDFSRLRWVWITPIDGTPVHPDWAVLTNWADGAMVISRFGVEAMRQAGYRVNLCHPGVDTTEFYPAEPDERAALRQAAGYEANDYIVGVVCMNQGRKAISKMVEAFYEFACDKPEARLLLDMDRASPAGWDVPGLLKQLGWTEAEQARVKFREDLFAGPNGQPNEPLLPLRNRYALMDAHMVISHREGFGLPLVESMACRLPTLALDWCSGTEIVGEGRGMLVRRLEYMEHGCWGGARDAFPDMPDLIAKLTALYDDRALAAHLAAAGYEWAKRQTWDVTTDQVETTIQAALTRPRAERSHEPTFSPAPTAGLSDTAGPARGADERPPTEPIRHHPKLQSAAGLAGVLAVANRDSPRGGDDGAAGNISPG